jgi:uncharacterized cupin superfamily protein
MGADVTVKKVDEMESIWGGSFVRARASLGASSFGMNVLNLPPHYAQYVAHNHLDPPVSDELEEIYTALSGTATLHVAGEEHVLEPGVFARVGAAETRNVTTGPEGAQLLCIGGTPGKAYQPLPIVELGGPDSL